MAGYDDQVFINVPFDRRYKKLLDALVFAVHDCGFEARCAVEEEERKDSIFVNCRSSITERWSWDGSMRTNGSASRR